MGRAKRKPVTNLIYFLLCTTILAGGLLFQFSGADNVIAAPGDQQRIVYLDRENNVWTARTDGSETQKLTTQGGFSNVQASPDGTRVLATGPHQGGSWVFLMSTDGAFGAIPVATGRLPVWSPDSSRFAFSQEGTVHVISRDGEYIISAAAGVNVLEWSPDGTKIGFARNVVDPYHTGCPVRQLGWINANSGSVETAGAMIGEFAWNRDGTALIHISAGDGAIRSRSTIDGSYRLLSNTTVNACRAPLFTTADGRHLVGIRGASDGETDLVVIDLESADERVYLDVPIRFPASTLPDAYVTGDASGRYVMLARSYPTDIHRLDLETGQIEPLLLNDWRRLVGFSPDGQYFALLHVPSGEAVEMTIRSAHSDLRMMENVGWMAWGPSLINQSSALAWQGTWAREDRPVATGESRTWIWGPNHFDLRIEPYDEAPGGFRAVRYYDKSRMEITFPFGDRSDEWYVTNGLLVQELVTGEMQVGDERFESRTPAQIPIAGDQNDPTSPTYESLRGVLDAPATPPGQEITATISRDGDTGNDGPGGVTATHYVDATDHTVADVFWHYLNSTGPIWDGSQIVDGPLFEPTFFATGLPITEAYWTNVRVAGEQREVLVQCFERRCLTYTPDNPAGWQVEMGNVGRHYYNWRYLD